MSDDSLSCKPRVGARCASLAQPDWHILPPNEGRSLGIVTKTSSPLVPQGLSADNLEIYHPETGEIKTIEPAADNGLFVSKYKDQYNPSQSRNKRFALKSVVNDLMPGTKTSRCMRFRAPDNSTGGLRDIEILKSSEHGKAFYHGLMACGRVWHCPVCAAKISERRRVELKQGLDSAKKKCLKAHFITLTIPHGIGDDINDLLERLRGATRRLSSGKYSVKSQLKKIDPNLSFHGFIRALEVTHGKNGFHPHYHIILFSNLECQTSVVQYVYSKAWTKACVAAGLPEPNELRGCVAKDGSYASEYVSKWGIEDEMTKANTKLTKQKGKSPWGLLDAVLQGDDSDYPPERARSLFRVYADAFKGQRQLYWSNGLRKLLQISKEDSDEVIVDRPDDVSSYLLAQIPFKDWKKVLKSKQEANLLTVAESNALAIKPFIENLPDCDDKDARRLSKDEEEQWE